MRRPLKGLAHALAMRRFVHAVATTPPDVIHFQWLPLPLVDGLALKALRRIAPLVFTLHDTTLFHGAPSSRLQGLGFRRAIARFDRVIVHTRYSRARAEQDGLVAPERLEIVPHGPFGYYRTLQGGVTRDDGAWRILFFGSIKPYKGLDLLIEALALLPLAVRERTRLVVAGEPGMSLGPLRGLAERRGVAALIEWRTEYIPEGDVAALFEAASVVALPYREIDQSGVLLTAAGFGKAVVSTRVGGIPEILGDGDRGILVEPGDADGLARALARALTDAELRARIGTALREWCDAHHSWAVAATATEALYRTLVASRAK
jgi:glycosyltransferase involved in cell wall biosynthesis